MSWAESSDAGTEQEAVQRGKLASVDWLTKWSPGLPVLERLGLKVSRHLCITKVEYVCEYLTRRTNAKDKRKKKKKLVESVFTTYLEDRREHRETTYIYRTLIRCMKISTVSRCLRSRYSGTPLIRPPSGYGNLVVLTGWSY